MDVDSLRRRLAASGAWLFAVGMVTGLWAAAVWTVRSPPPLDVADHRAVEPDSKPSAKRTSDGPGEAAES